MGNWVVARTKALRERWAAENVSRQGGTYYLPRLKPGKLAANKPPPCLFPSYLFVQLRDDCQWQYLKGTFGVSGIVMQGSTPALLPDSEIDCIRRREDNEGLIRLPSAPNKFRPGEQVRVTDGAFSGFRGIYQEDGAQDRVTILLDYLGAKRKVLIGEDYLEAAE